MFTFHKPKVFRSANGCCICKAKSSSSRFTDSKKYEVVFVKCFDLDELRSGEICNACVLLVKRFLKLPADSNRNWNHVVDARSGPGIKSLVKSKNRKLKQQQLQIDLQQQDEMESPEKMKKKHVYKRKNKAPMRQRNPSIAVSDFLDMTFWKREKVCCGTIFRGPFGEVAIDARYYNPCCFSCKKSSSLPPPRDESASKVPDNDVITDTEDDSFLMDDEDSNILAARRLSAVCSAAVVAASGDVEDEGFFDKPAASPLSGGSSPPPPSEDFEGFNQEEQPIMTRAIAASRFGDGT